MDVIEYYLDLLLATKRELIRYRFAAAFLASLVFTALLVMAFYWPERYHSSAVIEMDVTNVIEPLLRGKAEVVDSRTHEKVADTIVSRRVLERAVKSLAEKNGVEYSASEVEQKINLFRNSLNVEPVNYNRAITSIQFQSPDATRAFENLQVIVEAFLENKASEKREDSFAAYSFINEQVKKYKDQLTQADKNLQAFKANSADVTENVVKTRIGNLGAQIKDLNIAIEESKETLAATKRQLATESKYLSVRTKLIALEDRKVLMVEELDRLRLSYQDEYPDIVTLKTQLAEVNSAIETQIALMGGASSGNVSELPLYEELRKQYAAAELSLSTQKRRLAALENLLDEERLLADEVTKDQAELADLTRDYDVNKGLYEEMLGRKENAKLTMELNKEGQGENYKLTQPPTFPLKPSGLNPVLVLLAAPILALLTPFSLMLAFVMFDPRMRSIHQVKACLPKDVVFLGVAPHQSTPLNIRLLRKDVLLLGGWLLIVMAVYVYSLMLLQ